MTDRTLSTADLAAALDVGVSTVRAWSKLPGAPCDPPSSRQRGFRWADADTVAAWAEELGLGRARGKNRRTGVRAATKAALMEGCGPTVSRSRRRSREEVEDLEELDQARAEAKLRRDLAAAEQAELEVRAMERSLLPADEVEDGIKARVSYARAVLLDGLEALAADLEGQRAEVVEGVMKEWVFAKLTQLE